MQVVFVRAIWAILEFDAGRLRNLSDEPVHHQLHTKYRSKALFMMQTSRQTGRHSTAHTQISSHLAAASSRTGLDSLALTDLHCGLVVDGGRAHPFLDLSCHGQEGLLDIGGTLSGRLKERDSKAVSEFLEDDIILATIHMKITLLCP